MSVDKTGPAGNDGAMANSHHLAVTQRPPDKPAAAGEAPTATTDLLPRRGNGVSRWLASMLLRLLGWRVVGQPANVPKAVIIGGPHTSNWDGIFTLAAMMQLQLDARVMIKDSAFRWPLGGLLRWLGALPVARNSASDVVGQTVAQFHQHEKMAIIVSPEGTRAGASQWKTGFWRIAKAAGVPVIIATADYRKKEISFVGLLEPGEDMQADMDRVLAWFRDVEPRHPARLSAPLAALRRSAEKSPDKEKSPEK